MQINLTTESKEFLLSCKNMDWENMANLTIALENAISLIEEFIREKNV